MIVRLIRSGPQHPFVNMALDEAIGASPPVLRLYSFSPPGLSIGFFQTGVDAIVAADFIRVRRVTGGAAIAHLDDLTFAFVATPESSWFRGDVKESYARLHRAVARGLARLGVAASPRANGTVASDSGNTRDAVCFHAATSFDLVANGRKLVGSAQRRTRERVLHHGSIPIGKNVLASEAACLAELLGRRPAMHEVEDALIAGCADELGCEFRDDAPTADELARTHELVREKYGTEAWNAERRGREA